MDEDNGLVTRQDQLTLAMARLTVYAMLELRGVQGEDLWLSVLAMNTRTAERALPRGQGASHCVSLPRRDQLVKRRTPQDFWLPNSCLEQAVMIGQGFHSLGHLR
jgi:hypothetical protein